MVRDDCGGKDGCGSLSLTGAKGWVLKVEADATKNNLVHLYGARVYKVAIWGVMEITGSFRWIRRGIPRKSKWRGYDASWESGAL